jgi:hypothetical protein
VWEQGAEGLEEVAGEWRKLLSEELHNLYSPLNTVKVNMRWMGHVARKTVERTAYFVFCRKTWRE